VVSLTGLLVLSVELSLTTTKKNQMLNTNMVFGNTLKVIRGTMSVEMLAKYAIVVVAFFIILTQYLAYDGYLVNYIVGCEGIEEFYTGSFLVDSRQILNKSLNNNHGSVNYTTGDIQVYPRYPPKAILEEYKYDCQTVSNAIYCLAQLYDRECIFERSITFTSRTFYGHLGITCKNNETGLWENLY